MFLLLCPGLHDRYSAEHDCRDEGAGDERAAEFLEQHDQLADVHAGAVVVLRDDEAHPALLGHLLPQLRRVALLVVLHRAHQLLRALLLEEVAGEVLEHFLLFV